jgi:hypothetical protein
MIESPFSQVGHALLARGYAPIPIMPNDKKPGMMVGDDWRMFKGWNEFCLKRPTTFQVTQWAKWPGAGVGVALGMGLICVDIDQEEIVGPLLEILPASPAQKKGRKGISLFYRGDTEKIRSRNFRTPDRVGLADLLAEGKQTVLPPSVHPDTGEPYYWWSDETLMDLALGDLPELPDDIGEQIGEVLKAFGYDPDHERAEITPVGDGQDASPSQTTDFFRRLNEDALANIAAWAPKLALPKGRFMGRVYRAVAPWRGSGSGRPISRRSANLSISPGGIEDFGTGERFTALNVVMKALEISDAERDAAVQWLGEHLGYNFSVSIPLVNGPKTQARLAGQVEPTRSTAPAAVKESLTATSDVATNRVEIEATNWSPPVAPKRNNLLPGYVAPVPAAAPAEPAGEPVDDEPLDAEAEETAPSMAELEALCHPPGLVGEIMDWIVGSSSSPSRPLALGPALTFVGTLAGRHHSGPTDLRTNLYVVALAPSGYGKDHARKCIQTLAHEAGLSRYIGPEGYLSESAIRKTIENTPACVSLMDEFGGFIAKIMDRRAGTHQSGMRTMLMKLFTSSNGEYSGEASAAEAASKIQNPCLSVYGASTPHDFWPSMSGKGIADGFLPRWLCLTITGEPVEDVVPTAPREPPDRIKEWCRAIVTIGRGNIPDSSATRVKPHEAAWGPGAEDAFRRHRNAFKARGAKCVPELASLWTRSMEIALRLAHIVAIGVNPERPVLTLELIEWATALTELSTRHCIVEVRDRLASTEKQAEYLMVRRLIKEAGSAGLSFTRLKQQINGLFDLARLDAITKQLQESKQIEMRVAAGPSGGRPGARWYAR